MKLKVILLLSFLLFSSGCTVLLVGGATAVGSTYYISGEIRSSYNVSIYHLYKVTLYIFNEENIKTTLIKNTKTDADIQGILCDGKKIKVHIYYNDKDEATIGIRIGSLGDEKRSREILKKMQRYI